MGSGDPREGLPALEREVDQRSARRFVEANGERAALLGDEHGVFECWIWPIKVARDLALTVRAARRVCHARDCARRVRVSPCDVEIEYAGEGWRVAMRAFAARDRRALALTFAVETEEPLTLELAFTPEVKPMWPAGLGGQIALVDPETSALALTEELGRFAALIGSPDAAPLAVLADHSLPREPVALSIAVDPARAKRGPLTAFIAGAEIEKPPLSEAAKVGLEDAALGHARALRVLALAREEYRWIEREWMQALRAHADHWRGFLARTAHFESDDARHTQAFLWAKIAIEKAWVTVDGVGRGLVAGLAKSGAGERPGFGWFFDGDAMIAARAMCMYGDFEGARQVLEFAASHQRADGKMMHELTLAARWCDWLGDYPYAYYKANNTPDFIAAVADYFSWTGDSELVERLWPNVRKAHEFCVACLDDDGLMSNRKAGMAAVEAGPLVGKIRADIFLQGLWMRALEAIARLAEVRGEAAFAECERARLEGAQRALAGFWSERLGRYGFAHAADGTHCDDLTAYQAVSIRFGERRRALATAAALNAPAIATDWGVRFFAADSSLYDPASYNTGAVFPYATNFVVRACFDLGLTEAAHQLLGAQIALDGFSGLGFVPEHLRGDRCEAPPRGVPHQIFSSAAIVDGTLAGMLGIDSRLGDAASLWMTPCLPANGARVRVSRSRRGASTFELEISRERRYHDSHLVAVFEVVAGPALRVTFRPALPPLSHGAGFSLPCEPRVRNFSMGERRGRLGLWPDGGRTTALVHFPFGPKSRLELVVECGPELRLDTAAIEPGTSGSSLRVGQVEQDGHSVTWTLWGLAGRSYRLGWRSGRPVRFEGAHDVGPDELEIEFAGGDPGVWVKRELRAVALC